MSEPVVVATPAVTPAGRRGRRSIFVIAIVVSVLFGATLGLGAFTFVYARGASYLSDDPAACANCHVMRTQFEAWQKSSHHAVAVCNDCHAPPGGFDKYLTKARNGYHHSLAFTTGDFHEPIRITARNREVTEAQCRRCHAATVAAMGTHGGGTGVSCTRCHDSVGHRTAD